MQWPSHAHAHCPAPHRLVGRLRACPCVLGRAEPQLRRPVDRVTGSARSQLHGLGRHLGRGHCERPGVCWLGARFVALRDRRGGADAARNRRGCARPSDLRLLFLGRWRCVPGRHATRRGEIMASTTSRSSAMRSRISDDRRPSWRSRAARRCWAARRESRASTEPGGRF